MFSISSESVDSVVLEEIIRNSWPSDSRDAHESEESSWEILNENNSHDVLKRHWFKQNYVTQSPENISIITYH